MPAPELPEDIAFSDLDRAVRARLRTLSKENAENVGLHLVMTGRLLDSDPELAYEHAQAAVRRAGRVDVVREAAGLAAYRTGRFAEALRELRTVRRLNGSSEHLAVMADCERGLGRPERALTLAASPEAEGLAPAESVELAIVVSGARLDLGEPEAAIAVLRAPVVRDATGVVAVRVAQALAAAYEAAGRADDAQAALAGYSQSQLDEASGAAEEEDDVVVFDLDEDEDEHEQDGHEPAAATGPVSGSVSPDAAPGAEDGYEAPAAPQGASSEDDERDLGERSTPESDAVEHDVQGDVVVDADEPSGDAEPAAAVAEHADDAGHSDVAGHADVAEHADDTGHADRHEREGDA